ncbi:hypothetical protein SAMN05444371_3255 [Epilithonimonas mollis]|uniref:Uncharacterized protein n=1 Tax=Epilithonimonas mollis TaxID=216903 RepID=A0A1M6UAX6_9FLAO|nr:hypothetical protein SAMN05444371_3255 [Epilithonimonas mollis]
MDSFDNKIPSSGYVQTVRKNIVKKSLIQKVERRSPLVSEDAQRDILRLWKICIKVY